MTLDITAAYNEHNAAIRAYLYRHAPDVYEDIAGDVWLRVVRYADSYQDTGSLKAWLLQIATNRLIDYKRVWAKRTLVPIDEWTLPVPFDEPYLLDELLAALTKKQRAVVLCRLVGYSNQETADRLGMHYDAVKALLWRAWRKVAA